MIPRPSRLRNYHRGVRKTGFRPPAWLEKRLERLHPAVRLCWIPAEKKWALVQTDQPKPHLIKVLQDSRGGYVHPNIQNTIGLLNRCSPAMLRGKWRLERFCRGIDEENERDRIAVSHERAAQDRIGEMSERLWNLEVGRKAVQPHSTRQE